MKPALKLALAAIAFEGGLGLLGWGICRWQRIPLACRLQPVSSDALFTVAALIPLLGVLWFVMRTAWRPIVELRDRVEHLLSGPLATAPWPVLLVIALAAGIGEELLFRGALQPWMARGWGPAMGLAVASSLFGAAHALSWTYFLFAAGVGGYLGWLSLAAGSLVTPIAVHALYDFAALLVLRGRVSANSCRYRMECGSKAPSLE